MKIVDDKPDALRSSFPPRLRKHALRKIERGHSGTGSREPDGVTASAATKIQNR